MAHRPVVTCASEPRIAASEEVPDSRTEGKGLVKFFQGVTKSGVSTFIRATARLLLAAVFVAFGGARSTAADVGSDAARDRPNPSLNVTTVSGKPDPISPTAAVGFLSPVGVAVDRTGRVFVSDEASQRIFEIRNGETTTVAGSGAVGPLGFSVAGGYADGPAMQARFNHPQGIAVDKSGAILVADANNACIRRLHRGYVTTLIGKPGVSGAQDGTIKDATLTAPRAISVDSTGTAWIADYSVGLRRLLPSGRIETVSLKVPGKTVDPTKIFTVFAYEHGDDEIIFVGLQKQLLRFYPKSGDVKLTDEDESEDGARFGTIGQVIALGEDQIVFSDPRTNDLRYARLAVPLFATRSYSKIIAGGTKELGIDNAGFSDGPPEVAKFYSPRGIALSGTSLFIVDAGNRRLRMMKIPDFTTPEDVRLSSYSYDARHFEIAYVGASYTFYATSGPGSVCGDVSDSLTAARVSQLPVRCHSVRIDAASLDAVKSYVREYLSAEHVDLLILPLMPRVVSGSPNGGNEFLASLQEIQKDMPNTRVLVVLYYEHQFISDSEAAYLKQVNPARDTFPDENFATVSDQRSTIESVLRGTRFLFEDPFAKLIAYERNPDQGPLFFTDDHHGTALLNRLNAESIAAYLLSPPVSSVLFRDR